MEDIRVTHAIDDTDVYTAWGKPTPALLKRRGHAGRILQDAIEGDILTGDAARKAAENMDGLTRKAKAIALFDTALLRTMFRHMPASSEITIGLMDVPNISGGSALLMTDGKEEIVLMPMRGDLQIEPEFMDVPLLGQAVTADDILEELRRALPAMEFNDYAQELTAAAAAIVAMIKGEAAND